MTNIGTNNAEMNFETNEFTTHEFETSNVETINIDIKNDDDNFEDDFNTNVIENIIIPKPKTILSHHEENKIWFNNDEDENDEVYNKSNVITEYILNEFIQSVIETKLQYVHPLVFVKTCSKVYALQHYTPKVNGFRKNSSNKNKNKPVRKHPIHIIFNEIDMFKLRMWCNQLRNYYKQDKDTNVVQYIAYSIIFRMMLMEFKLF